MRKAIVITGGDESRLWPLTHARPRALLPVVNRPMLAHQLEWLRRAGLTEVLVVLGRHADAVRAEFADGHAYGIHLSYQVEEEPHGGAGSVKRAETWLGGETCLVAPGDLLTDVDLVPLQRQHWNSGAWLTLGLLGGHGPAPHGMAALDDRGAVLHQEGASHEAGEGARLVNSGIYCVEPDALQRVPGGQTYDFGLDLVPQLLGERLPVSGAELKGYWRPVGNFAEYRRAHREALEARVDVCIPARRCQSGVWLGENVEIAPTAVVEGPVLIGPGSRIGPEALILPGTVIGERCVVGAGACVWGAVLGSGCRVGPDTTLRDCVVDDGAQIAVAASVPEGAVVGSGCRLAAGARLHAGQRVQPDQVIHGDRHRSHDSRPRGHSAAERNAAATAQHPEAPESMPACGCAAHRTGSPAGGQPAGQEMAGREAVAAGGRR